MMNKAAMNIKVHVFGWICVFISLGVELLCHVLNVKLFFKGVVPFYFPTGNEWESHQVLPLLINNLLNFSHCNGCIVVYWCGFNFHFLDGKLCSASTLVPGSLFISSFVQFLFNFFAHYLS